MTVSAQTPRSGPYSGNGSTTAFDYGFFVNTDDEIVVTVADAAGAETIKTLTTDYTVSGAGNAAGAGGAVTFVTAPLSTEQVVVTRAVALTQAVDLQNRKSVVPTVLETAYDKLTRIVQDQNEQLGRSVKVDLFGTTDMAALTVNINTVAGVASAVSAVAGIAAAVSTVAGNIAAVQGADAAATAAAASLASFEQIYLGMKSSPPTVDNAGNALITGAQYFDSVTNKPFIWTTADEWSPAVFDAAGALLESEVVNVDEVKAFDATDYATAAQGSKADSALQSVTSLTQVKVEDGTDTTFGLVSGQRLSQAATAFSGVISKTVVSAPVASVDLTGFDATKYTSYEVELMNVIPVTDNVQLHLRTSSNGGSSFDSGASDYETGYGGRRSNASEMFGGGAAADGLIAPEVGSAAGEDGVSGTIRISGPDLAKRTLLNYKMANFNESGFLDQFSGAIMRNAAASVDAVQLFFSSGNIESGTIVLRGIR